MNQITQMFKESNDRMKKILSGNYRHEVIADGQHEAEIQIKLANVALSAYSIASKNKRTMTGLERMNLMDETTAIDLGSSSEDKVRCPGCQRLITRDECLDTSGSKTPYEECDGCEIGKSTKDKLLPEKL